MKTFINTVIPPTLTDNDIFTIGILITLFSYLLIKIISTYKRLGKKSLLRKNRTLIKLKRLSWSDFELLCIELFEKQGWSATGNSKKGADGGIDIHMKKKKIKAIVQCKRYDETRVTVKILREMYGLMHEHEADKAYIVTTSLFTKECYKYIDGKNIELINGLSLVRLISKC
jgi:restriction system protein